MFGNNQIQSWILATEVGIVARCLRILSVVLALVVLVGFYDLRAYRGFNSPEAMDAAQVARHLAEGKGYSTDFIRPFSLFLVRRHNYTDNAIQTNADFARINVQHPDLANAPVYPTVLAGLFKMVKPKWNVDTRKPFWSEGGRFVRYQPEVFIALFNQFLLFTTVALTFLLARAFFDPGAAWLAAALTLGSDLLWKFSVSGQSTMLLVVIFLGLLWCLTKVEQRDTAGPADTRRLFFVAITAGVLTGVGMLTRYSFGWVIVPVVVFHVLYGGPRRGGLALTAFLAFFFVVSPWAARNLVASGTFFGTAGYAVVEGNDIFPGNRLMQSLNPDLSSWIWYNWLPISFNKFLGNIRGILQGDLLRLGGGWMGVLYLAGLLLALRSATAHRIRQFSAMCLIVFVVVQALGRTQLSTLSPELNSENLLVLLTPIVMILGATFFLTLVNQMNVPSRQLRYTVIGLLVAIACQPLIATLLPPKSPPTTYPPYYPPDIQKIAGWMKEDELLMSDAPWAVAWYGKRQCSWTTLNSQYEFVALNDFIKPVRGLYLTLITIDGKLYSECFLSKADNWNRFAYNVLAYQQLPKNFPLQNFPAETLRSGLFLSDRKRW